MCSGQASGCVVYHPHIVNMGWPCDGVPDETMY